jgi:hypothetical protein
VSVASGPQRVGLLQTGDEFPIIQISGDSLRAWTSQQAAKKLMRSVFFFLLFIVDNVEPVRFPVFVWAASNSMLR